jgi:hypothetical protein
VGDGGANAGHLVGADRHADAGAADEQPAAGVPSGHRLRDIDPDMRIGSVIGCIRDAQVDDVDAWVGFKLAPALSAPIATTYRSLAMVQSPVYVDTPRRTSCTWLTRIMSSIGMQIGSHCTSFFARRFSPTPAQGDLSWTSLLLEPGAEGVQDVVDRRRASILDAPRALA